MIDGISFNKLTILMFTLTVVLPVVIVYILLEHKQSSLKQHFLKEDNIYCGIDDFRYIVVNKNRGWSLNGDYFVKGSIAFKILECSSK